MEDAVNAQLKVPQHLTALARANRVRLAKAELKRAIARGEIAVADVIEDVPWEAESMTLAELLTSQRRWGRTRARKFLQNLALSENKRVGTLASRQRSVLLVALKDHPALRSPAARPPGVAEAGLQDEHAKHWRDLSTVAERQEELAAELAELTKRRDELICTLSAAGASRRAVAEAAALTVGRVQQIVADSDAMEHTHIER